MKKCLLALCLLGFAVPQNALAQDETDPPAIPIGEHQDFQQVFDSLTGGLIKERIPYGVLRNRALTWTTTAMDPEDSISSPYDLYQAWWDIEQCRVLDPVNTYDDMRHRTDSLLLQRIVPVMTIDYNYALLDSNAFLDGRLRLQEGILTDNGTGEAPYTTGHMQLTGLPLDNIAADEELTLVFRPDDFTLENTGAMVRSVKIEDPSEGIALDLAPGEAGKIRFTKEGAHTLLITSALDGQKLLSRWQLITVGTPAAKGTAGADCDVAHQLIESAIPFQGYNEPYATTSFGDYHIFYHFKAGTTDCERILKKPIIIMDGYDPQDANTWDDIYSQYLSFGASPNKRYLGDELRALGYDVIILNFPKLGAAIAGTNMTIPSYVRKGSAGSLTGDAQSHNGRDGGTDFIERNAFVAVELLKLVNDKLRNNGSAEQVVVVGPSMGGQISRYALAYMEKQYAAGDATMQPNTRLWVSFDSPHWGANIPMATQRTLKWFGYNAGQQDARDAYDRQLAPPAGRQLLIEQIDGEQNNGTPGSWRQRYMTNLLGNGTAGSYGWPSGRAPGGAIRKVSLLNGCGGGTKTAAEGQQYIDAKGTLAGITLFSIDARYLKAPGQNGMYWQGKTTSSIVRLGPLNFLTGAIFFAFSVQPSAPFYTTNINPRGTMDVVPGSTYPSTQSVKEKFTPALTKAGIKNQSWNILAAHSFIPSASALAFNNPEFNWNLPVNNRDLVCNNEIPFDSYFIPEANEQHITLTEKNVAWITQEIERGGKAGCIGAAPVCTGRFNAAPGSLCVNATATYTLDVTPPAGTTTSWTVSNSALQIQSTTSSSVTVTGISSSIETVVTATVNNPCGADKVITKKVAVGRPVNHNVTITHYGNDCEHFAKVSPYLPGAYTYQWSNDGVTYTNGGETYGSYFPNRPNQEVWLKVTNGCGSYIVHRVILIPQPSGGNCAYKMAPGNDTACVAKRYSKVYPNPAAAAWHIVLMQDVSRLDLTLRDINGRIVYKSNIADPDHTDIAIPNEQLPVGWYHLTVTSNLGAESYRLIKSGQ